MGIFFYYYDFRNVIREVYLHNFKVDVLKMKKNEHFDFKNLEK